MPDNDTDDYTMAVVVINEKFGAIRESGRTVGSGRADTVIE